MGQAQGKPLRMSPSDVFDALRSDPDGTLGTSEVTRKHDPTRHNARDLDRATIGAQRDCPPHRREKVASSGARCGIIPAPVGPIGCALRRAVG